MSSYGYCDGGGLDGIVVKDEELFEFAKMNGREFIDEIIPLPFPDNEKQKSTLSSKCGCPINHENFDHGMYYETETNSHGWCCNVCGKVIQWG